MRQFVLIILITIGDIIISAGQGLGVPTNLPIMTIDTRGLEVVDDPKIPADMAIIYNGPGKMNSVTDQIFDFKGTIGIEYRGSSSQQFDKKPYAIEIQDGSGNSIDASLLGMPAKDDWVLDASYDDKTLMRNELAYKLGRAMGRYASRTRLIELVIGGYYQGVYALQEKVKRDKYRVNIAKLDPTSVSGDDVTGGYIIKIDKPTGSGGGDGWYSPYPPEGNGSPIFFQYDYPKAEDLVAAQKTYIQNYVGLFEQSLSANNFADPINGYAKYIDVPSFIDFFLMQEVTKNPDGYRLSTYFSKQKDSEGGKLSMGPIWDFNEGFGNVDYCTKGNSDGFAWEFNLVCPTDSYQVPFWWNKLLSDRNFKQAMAARWQSLRQGSFQNSVVQNYVDSVAAVLSAGAQQRNFQLWPVIGQYVWPNYYVETTYDDGISWMKDWIDQRLAWLDQNLPQIVSGIDDDPKKFSVSIFPNPFVQDVIAEVQIQQPGDVDVELWDMLGRKLQTVHQSYEAPGKYQTQFHLPQSSTGMFYFKCKMGEEVIVTKAIGR